VGIALLAACQVVNLIDDLCSCIASLSSVQRPRQSERKLPCGIYSILGRSKAPAV
jgi:hypothetical protein